MSRESYDLLKVVVRTLKSITLKDGEDSNLSKMLGCIATLDKIIQLEDLEEASCGESRQGDT